MKATEAKLLEFLKKSPQFVIPIYQRTYSWTKRECQQLWDDIFRAGKSEDILAHFVGSIVYIEKDIYQVTSQSPLLVIDGQQRLTTVTLLLSALAQFLDELEESKREPLDGFSPRKIRNYYLMNPEEDGERKYKLLLSQTDKASLIAILDKVDQPKEHSIRIDENFIFFQECLKKHEAELETICKGVAKLIVVDIALSRGHDNPQLIFESMNSTGKELSQADLIRNFILMGLEPTLQTRLYEQYWRPMEKDFGQEAYGTHFDGFMRNFLTVKTGDVPRIGDVYEAFKEYARTKEVSSLGIESIVKDIRENSKFFCSIALSGEKDSALKLAFHDLKELKVDVAYPFILKLYADYQENTLSKDDFVTIVRLVESYVFRRAICNIPTNSMNKTFAAFMKFIDKEAYLESVKAHFLLLPSYRRFPSDEEFNRDIQNRDLYNFRSRTYWLKRLENYGRKENVPVDEYTIEHILPQNEKLPPPWKESLGPNWENIQKKYLHTLGNLTLTGYNSEYSDKPFASKRDMEGGFKESPIRLNKGLGLLEKWGEEEINGRAQRLADEAVKAWTGISLQDDILMKYKSKDGRDTESEYAIEDHPHLADGAPMRELFDLFSAAVKRLDPCVSEEFLKLYVAFKAETNFVDVIPQAKRLRLSLNISMNDINDPKGICRDVAGKGRWGNGDVEVGISNKDELPYVIGLVRQALEQQMDQN